MGINKVIEELCIEKHGYELAHWVDCRLLESLGVKNHSLKLPDEYYQICAKIDLLMGVMRNDKNDS